MAIMIPDSVREGTASLAEKRLFGRFRRELPDNIYVLHSLGLTNHKNKLWGECDFVIVSPTGVFVIEVKGGGVACKDGLWIYTRHDGGETKKPEGPFEQAKTAMFAVREVLIQKDHLKRCLVGYGVIMPDEVFVQEGPEIELGVLLDSRQYEDNLEDYLHRLSGFWTNCYRTKHGAVPKILEKPVIEEIRSLLRPEVRTALTLSSTLSKIDKQQVELTDEQCRILRRMDKNPRTLVCGGAGTGKTILAIDKALQKAGSGQKVLFLCYNRLLGNHIKSHAKEKGAGENLEVNSIHAWFHEVIREAGLETKLKSSDNDDHELFTRRYPEVFMDAFIQLEKECFDCLILDEAQDLLQMLYLDSLDLVLKGGLSEGNWHFFMDPLQNIFLGTDEELIGILKEYGFAQFDLTINCRNTKGVAVTTSTISGIDLPIEGAVDGGRSEVKYFTNIEGLRTETGKTLEKLFLQGVRRDDIIILSSSKFISSCLSGLVKLAGSKICDLTEEISARGAIDFCTFQAFKGLERKVVVAIDLKDLESDQSRLLHYCGLSRARSVLIVFLSDRDKDTYIQLAYRFGERMAERSP
jgi:ATP:corrinoid adenosyltransferase